MARRLRLAAAVLLAAAFTGGPSAAQTDAGATGTPAAAAPTAETKAPAQPWIVNCTNQDSGDTLRCTVSQTIVARDTGQRVLSAVIFRDAGNALKMTLGLPHGLDLPAGVILKVDEGQPFTVSIRTADQNGSYATLDLTPDFVAGLKSGTELDVGITAAAGGVVTLKLSLTGFTAAFGKI